MKMCFGRTKCLFGGDRLPFAPQSPSSSCLGAATAAAAPGAVVAAASAPGVAVAAAEGVAVAAAPGVAVAAAAAPFAFPAPPKKPVERGDR